MTFLQLVTRFCQECDVSISQLNTTVNQSGELLRMVNWLASAWFRIQGKHQDWRFLRNTAIWTSVDGQRFYTFAQATLTKIDGVTPAVSSVGGLETWLEDSFRNYVTANGTNSEIPMTRMPYADFRDLWMFGANRGVKSRPYQIAKAPDDSIGFGPMPAGTGTYTLLGDFYAAPYLLANDTDVPSLPAKHDPMIIVFEAMKSYGGFWGAAEVYNRGTEEFKKLYTALEIDQLEPAHFQGCLT